MPVVKTQPVQADDKEKLLDLFSFGFGEWLVRKSHEDVLRRIAAIDGNPLGRAQLNQLLHLCHEGGFTTRNFLELLPQEGMIRPECPACLKLIVRRDRGIAIGD